MHFLDVVAKFSNGKRLIALIAWYHVEPLGEWCREIQVDGVRLESDLGLEVSRGGWLLFEARP